MAVVDFVARWLDLQKVDPTITAGEILTVAVLALTLLVLGVYTFFTIRLWKEAHLQTSLLISPFLLFEIDNGSNFFIKNAGNSPAFNISMESLYILVNDTSPKSLFYLAFESIGNIEAKSRMALGYNSYRNGKITPLNLSDHLNPKYQMKSNYRFTLSYTNPIGLRFVTIFSTGKDGIKVSLIKRERFWHYGIRRISQQMERLRLISLGFRVPY